MYESKVPRNTLRRGGVCGVMDNFVGNGHIDKSSKPG